jgi:hypothetical protein
MPAKKTDTKQTSPAPKKKEAPAKKAKAPKSGAKKA